MSVCPCCKQVVPPKAKNPAQPDLPIKDTRWEKQHNDGYETGLNWDANWMPGGPDEYKGEKGKNASYLTGFNLGLAERLKTNKRFKRWWYENYPASNGDLRRYTEIVR